MTITRFVCRLTKKRGKINLFLICRLITDWVSTLPLLHQSEHERKFLAQAVHCGWSPGLRVLRQGHVPSADRREPPTAPLGREKHHKQE